MRTFNRVSKLTLATSVFVLAAVFGLSTITSAGSSGQLAGGNNYVARNITQNTPYSDNTSATCNDEVGYSMELSNTQFGALNDVTLKASLPSGGGTTTVTATTAQGGSTGTSDTTSASLTPAGATQSLENGTTMLFDSQGNAIKTLPDTITTGVDIGTLNGSTTEFVNFKVKVSCPTPPPPPPPPSPIFSCDQLEVKAGDNRSVTVSTFNVTAQNGATFSSADINWGDGNTDRGLNPVVGKSHQYSADGTYTIAATAHFSVNGQDKTATSPACTQIVTFKTNVPPTVVTPPSPPLTTTTTTTSSPSQLVNTGPASVGSIAGLYALSSLVSYIIFNYFLRKSVKTD